MVKTLGAWSDKASDNIKSIGHLKDQRLCISLADTTPYFFQRFSIYILKGNALMRLRKLSVRPLEVDWITYLTFPKFPLFDSAFHTLFLSRWCLHLLQNTPYSALLVSIVVLLHISGSCKGWNWCCGKTGWASKVLYIYNVAGKVPVYPM